MKKFLAVTLSIAMVLGSLTACNSGSTTKEETTTETTVTAPAEDVAMQYISVADAATKVGAEGYTFLDVRKAADYTADHIEGAISADMDAVKNGDFAAGVATMEPIAASLDGTVIVVCYAGKSYAQAGTNVLSALGYDMTKVYTLEGGFTAWTEAN